MYLVTVIPISSSAHADILDYFSKELINPGMIVSVPLRKQTIRALVVQTTSLAAAKGMVKSSTFAMRKVIDVIGPSPLSTATLDALNQSARYLGTSVGVIIANIVPAEYLQYSFASNSDGSAVAHHRATALQASLDERIKLYTKLVSQGKKLLIIVPADGLQVRLQNLCTGNTVISVPQRLTQKKIQKLEHDARDANIVIGSPNALGMVDMLKPGIIIIESESDNRYIRQKAPHIDIRTVAEFLAGAHAQCIFADTSIRTHTQSRIDLGEIAYYQTPTFPIIEKLTLHAHVKNEEKADDRRHPFFSQALQKQLGSARKAIIYAPRKGLAPTIVCQDCGTQAACGQCDLPFRLVQKKDASGERKNFYACKHVDHAIPAYNICTHCGGHRLAGLGVTTLRMQEELSALYPNQPLFVLDQDETPKEKDQKALIETFTQSPAAFLIATSLVFPYLQQLHLDAIIIPSLDMLLSQPDPEAHEAIIKTLVQFNEGSTAPITLQTRVPHAPLFEHMRNNTIADWYDSEIKLRSQYGIPPYSTALIIHARLTPKTTAQFSQNLAAFPEKPVHVIIIKGNKSNQLVGKAVFRLPLHDWNKGYQNERWYAVVKALPAGYHAQLSTNA